MRRRGSVLLALLVLTAWPLQAQERIEPAERLDSLQREIERLQTELAQLERREQGVLGQLDRLAAEMRLRAAEQRRVSLQLKSVSAAIDQRTRRLEVLESAQQRRRSYLAFRVRSVYRNGPQQALQRIIGGARLEEYLDGLRYAAHLSERDVRVLRDYRADRARLEAEQAELVAERSELEGLRAELARARRRLELARRERETMLERIRQDQTTRESALGELAGAADELSRVVDAVEPHGGSVALDVRKFRGLLDWPAAGELEAGFGSVVHPRFKTRLPHPGWDITGREGTDIVSVFDGRVVFASWMRGYGLTALVDHGNGVLSIYAHASVLLVEPGQSVVRGQRLGKIGDTGSLRGPLLYFELRVDGRPVDPRGWLRPRRRD